jgi:hypothetical protein
MVVGGNNWNSVMVVSGDGKVVMVGIEWEWWNGGNVW